MSQHETEPNIQLPTMAEINALADGKYADETGSLLGGSPERMQIVVDSNLAIMQSLSGQQKADFVLRKFFAGDQPGVERDNEHIWDEMSKADPQAADWIQSRREQDQAARDESREIVTKLAAVCLKQLDAHPKTTETEFNITGLFAGHLGSRALHFSLWQQATEKKSPWFDVYMPIPPEPFDIEQALNAIRRSERTHGKHVWAPEPVLLRQLSDDGIDLVEIGHILSYIHGDGIDSYALEPVVISAEAPNKNFLETSLMDMEASRRTSIDSPFMIKSDLGRPSLTVEEGTQIVEMVENGEPIA
jgi:hypothetical protein